ncbi:MAG: hypothetical protein A2Y94_06635 [Caldithrix sp. RBG_13_44_9]|nr:MAG: hypothetical protein A2Y94_06635 [Caldithrix sp. RBG_13_44_9]
MKKHVILISAIGILLLIGWLNLTNAQEPRERDSQLTIPWEEFKKLLNLEGDQITLPMETFQKLLAQTGISNVPAYTVSGGNVILTREEFQKLVDQMKPPVSGDSQPPFDYLITKAVYSGKMGKQTTNFNGIFTVHVLKRDAYLRIPLLPQNMALEDVKVEGKAALVVSENGFHQVVLSKPGEYTIIASFSIRTEMDRGPHRMDLYIQQTPITLLSLDMPLRDIDIEIPQAQQLSTSLQDSRTLVSAVITPGQYISIQWRKKLALTEKIPPKLYSEIYHLISIDDDALRLNSDVTFNILHSEIDAVRFLIPDNMNILSVTGEGVGEWQESVQDNRRLILVPFTYGKKGGVVIQVTAEVPLSESGLGNIFTGFRTLETVRETGFMGVELNTSAEVTLLESESVEKVPPQKLPDQLVRKSLKPLIMGFKYLRHPYNLVLDVKKHEKIAVPVATINNANIVTLFTEDGKVVHRLIYQVRNSAKQFLEIQLPADADVWSVFVDNQPVEASLNQERKLLVPLIRSREVNNQLETFPVEVILALSEKNFSGVGSRGSALPAVDLLISQLIWSVYLPNDYSYNYFTSTLEKEEMIRGLNIFSGAQRRYNEKAMREILPSMAPESNEMFDDKVKRAYEGKDAESRFKNVPMEQQQLSSQMAAEMEFSGRMEKIAQGDMAQPSIAGGGAAAGFLPIMIQIPTNGQVYRFAKTIIKPDDPLIFNVVYSQMWLNSLLKWLVLIIVILIIYRNRRRLNGPWNWLKDKFNFGKSWYEKYQNRLNKIAGSIMTPFILFGLVIVFWPVSVFLTIVFLFLLWVSIVYQVLFAFRRRKERLKIQPEPEVIVIEADKSARPEADSKT